jgi:hypothetical protein
MTEASLSIVPSSATTPARSSVGSFLPQIRKAYAAVDGSALAAAIECGKFLTLEKENVEAEHGKRKWRGWLKKYCPEIPQSTDKLYRKLYDHQDDIADCGSIRKAIEKLDNEVDDDDGHPANTVSSIADDPLLERLQQVGHDSAVDAKKKEAATASRKATAFAKTIATRTPDQVFVALKEWDRVKLRNLTTMLANHVKSLESAA